MQNENFSEDGKEVYESLSSRQKKPYITPFGAMVEYHPISARDQTRLHQFGKTVLPRIFVGYALIAGRIWKGDILIADTRELENTDASGVYIQRINAKEVLIITKGRRIHIPSCRWYSKVVGKRLRIPRTHSEAGTNREE